MIRHSSALQPAGFLAIMAGMRNQYFGDKRDLLKYDLLSELVEGLHLPRLTNVVMLTEDDGTREGRQLRYQQGQYREDLYHFLRFVLAAGRRNVSALEAYFADRPYSYSPYYCPFRHADRQRYFAEIPEPWLQDSLVFLDPDIGLEDRRAYALKQAHKYVFYDEVKALADRTQGVIVIYQHLPRNRKLWPKTIGDKVQRLSQRIGRPVSALSGEAVAFLVIGDGDRVLKAYGKKQRLVAH